MMAVCSHVGRSRARRAALSEMPGSVSAPLGTAVWSSDGSDDHLAVETARAMERSHDGSHNGRLDPRRELAALVHTKVPWRVVGSRLVRSVTMWHATIVDRGQPLINQRLTLVFRKPADLSSSSTWNATALSQHGVFDHHRRHRHGRAR